MIESAIVPVQDGTQAVTPRTRKTFLLPTGITNHIADQGGGQARGLATCIVESASRSRRNRDHFVAF